MASTAFIQKITQIKNKTTKYKVLRKVTGSFSYIKYLVAVSTLLFPAVDSTRVQACITPVHKHSYNNVKEVLCVEKVRNLMRKLK